MFSKVFLFTWLAVACGAAQAQMWSPTERDVRARETDAQFAQSQQQPVQTDRPQEKLPTRDPFDELNKWFATSREQVAAGKMKPSEMYRGAYDRVTRFEDAPEKFLFLRDLSTMLDAALALEHKRITKDEFDSALRSADITYREGIAKLESDRAEQQAKEKALADERDATARLQAIRADQARAADVQMEQRRQAAYEEWRRSQMIGGILRGMSDGLHNAAARQPPPPSQTNCTTTAGVGGSVQTNCTQYQIQH